MLVTLLAQDTQSMLGVMIRILPECVQASWDWLLRTTRDDSTGKLVFNDCVEERERP